MLTATNLELRMIIEAVFTLPPRKESETWRWLHDRAVKLA